MSQEKTVLIKQMEQSIEHMLELSASACLRVDAGGLSEDMYFSDQALINAMIVFNSVTSNRAVHNMQKNKVDLEFAIKLAEDMGQRLRELFKARTGIDSHTSSKK